MRTINSSPDIDVGKRVVVKKEYKSGNHHLNVGQTGNIVGVSSHSLPDFGLFNIKVFDIEFSSFTLSWGEGIVREFLRVL